MQGPLGDFWGQKVTLSLELKQAANGEVVCMGNHSSL